MQALAESLHHDPEAQFCTIQLLAEAEPGALEDPSGHQAHAEDSEVLPAPVPYFRAAHGTHAVDPADVLYEPLGHAVWEPAPVGAQ